MIPLSILILCQYYSVQIAAYEISENYADIYAKNLKEMSLYECKRNTEEIEGICHAVRKSAYNEERDSENKRQILVLTGKLHGCGHDESATYGKKSAFECACSDSELKDLLSRLLNGKR